MLTISRHIYASSNQANQTQYFAARKSLLLPWNKRLEDFILEDTFEMWQRQENWVTTLAVTGLKIWIRSTLWPVPRILEGVRFMLKLNLAAFQTVLGNKKEENFPPYWHYSGIVRPTSFWPLPSSFRSRCYSLHGMSSSKWAVKDY